MAESFLRIGAEVNGEQSCIFCERPTTGHLVSEFEKKTKGLKGIAIAVCDICEIKKSQHLVTGFENEID